MGSCMGSRQSRGRKRSSALPRPVEPDPLQSDLLVRPDVTLDRAADGNAGLLVKYWVLSIGLALPLGVSQVKWIPGSEACTLVVVTPRPITSPAHTHNLIRTLALALARTHTLTLTVGALHDGAVAVNMATRDHGFEEWFEEVWLPSLDKTVQPTRASAEASNRLDITNRTAAISRTLSALTLFLPPVPSPFPLPITTPPSSSRGISRW